jgi:CHAT domain-containing protein
MPPVDVIQQQLLGSGSLLLVYSLGESESYLWAIDSSSVRSFVIGRREVLERQARAIFGLLRSGMVGQERPQLERLTSTLSEWVLGPVAGDLGTRRLVIVADGALHLVPFALLPEPGSEIGAASPARGRPEGRPEPLVARHEIVNLPSIRVLAAIRARSGHRQEPIGQVAMLCDPVLSECDERLVERLGSRSRCPESTSGNHQRQDPSAPSAPLGWLGERFPALPQTSLEAEAIEQMVPPGQALRLCGLDASREAAMDPILGRYRIIYIAAHGLSDPASPSLSGLVLSAFDEQGAPVPPILRSFEIRELDLGAELVVLSACRAAHGRQLDGEGLMSLTRAFMEAGAAGVIVSLWDVDDEVGSELMLGLFRRMLEDGLPPPEALSEAQLALMGHQVSEDPYYWSGFLFFGDWLGGG